MIRNNRNDTLYIIISILDRSGDILMSISICLFILSLINKS